MNINTQEVTLKSFKHFFKYLLDIDSPAYMVGAPGAGKSTSIEALGNEFGYRVITIMLGQTQPGDIGIPTVRAKHPEFTNAPDQVLEWAIAKWLVELDPSKPTLFFLDEFDKASPDIVSQVLDLLLNKRILGFQLPPETRIIAAGNRLEDQSGSYVMGRATADRLVVFQIKTDVNEWLEWALEKGIHPSVLAFIASNTVSLCSTTGNEDMITPSPRSWAGKVSPLLHLIAPVGTNHPIEVYNKVAPIISGIVGCNTSNALLSYLEDSVVLPTMADLLKMSPKQIGTLEITKAAHIFTLGYNAISYAHSLDDVQVLLKLFNNILIILDKNFKGKSFHAEGEQMLFLLLSPACAKRYLPNKLSWYTALQSDPILERINSHTYFSSGLTLSDLQADK